MTEIKNINPSERLTRGSLLARNTVFNFIGQGAPIGVAVLAIPTLIKGRWIWKSIAMFKRAMSHKGSLALMDQGVSSATNFLTGVIIGRACTKEQFGLYMLGLSIVLFVTNLQTSLISTPYMIYSPRLRGSAHARYTGSTLIHQLGVSVVAILCLVVAGAALSLGVGPEGLAPVVWILAGVITFIMLRDYARRVCFAGLRMKTALLLDSCVSVIQIGGLLLLAYSGVLSASLAYWAVGFACGVSALGWLIWMRKQFILRLSRSLSDLVRNWSLGKWIFASGLLWALTMGLYPWILAGFHGTASTGVWAACLGIVAIVNPLLFGIQNFVGPKIAHSFAEGGRIKLRRFAFKASAVFSVLMIPFCVLLLVFGGSLMVLFYGDKYVGNGLVVSILALNMLVSAAGFPYVSALFAMKRADLEFAVNFIALFVLLTLGLWLVRALGPLGAAYGLLIANIATSAVKGLICAVLTDSSGRRQMR